MAKEVTQFDFAISSSWRRGKGENQCCPSPVQNVIVSGAVKDAEHEMDSASQSLDDHVADRLESDDDGETESVINMCEKDFCIDCCEPNRESPNQPTSSTIPLKTKLICVRRTFVLTVVSPIMRVPINQHQVQFP